VPLKITVPEEIAHVARARARESGVSAETLVLEALRAHFGPLPTELQDELEAWERASDDDLARLEGDAGLG
jgi:hypothetical protein